MAFGSRPRPFGFSSPLMSDPAGLQRQAFGLPGGFAGAPNLGVPQPPAINFGGPQAPPFGFGLPTARPVHAGRGPFDYGQAGGLGGIDDGDDDLGSVPLPPQRPDDASLLASAMEPNTPRRTAAVPAQSAPRETPDASALPIVAPGYTSLAPSGSNAPAATALPAPAPAQPATGETSFGDDLGAALKRFRENDGFATLGSIGLGLLSAPTWGQGLATGLAYDDQRQTRQALLGQQKVDAALKVRKAQREAQGENQTVALLERNGIPRESAEAYVAAAAAGNRDALSNALNRISPKPAEAGSGYTAPDPLTGRSSFIPGGSQDPATIAAQAQARHISEPQLVDVPQSDGSTVKTWLGKGAAAGVPVGAPKAAAPNVREFTGPDGSKQPYSFDPATQQWRAMDVDGGAPQPGGNPYASGGRFTNEQGRAAGFTDRMIGTEGTLRSTESVNTTPGLSNIAGSSLYPNALKTDERQKMEQAQRDFVNAQLRRESGAAISQKEFDNARQQYFPQPGDGEAVIAQKRQNRQRAIEAMGREGGPSYRPGSVFDKDGGIVPYRPPGAMSGAPSRSALEAEARRRGLVR